MPSPSSQTERTQEQNQVFPPFACFCLLLCLSDARHRLFTWSISLNCYCPLLCVRKKCFATIAVLTPSLQFQSDLIQGRLKVLIGLGPSPAFKIMTRSTSLELEKPFNPISTTSVPATHALGYQFEAFWCSLNALPGYKQNRRSLVFT